MREMANVVNVGTQKRQQLMVPESSLMDWLRNHRMFSRAEMRLSRENLVDKNGKVTRIDRRTGKLKAV